MEITIKDCEGNIFTGVWNEQIYVNESSIELYSLYIDNNKINVTEGELDRVAEEKEEFKVVVCKAKRDRALKLMVWAYEHINNEDRVMTITRLYSDFFKNLKHKGTIYEENFQLIKKGLRKYIGELDYTLNCMINNKKL